MVRMANFVLAAAVFLFSASPAMAQTEFGAKAGLTFSNASGDGLGDTESVTGAAFGVFGQFGVAPRFSVQPGIYYVEKGFEQTTVAGEEETTISYVEIPVLLRFAFPTPGSFGVHLFGGPSLSFETACDVDFDTGGASGDCDDGGPVVDRNSTLFGLQLGAGVSMGFPGGSSVFLEGMLGRDFQDFQDAQNSDAKNQYFGVNAGFSIAVGG